VKGRRIIGSAWIALWLGSLPTK